MNKAREYALDALKNQIELIENAYNAGYADALSCIPKPDVESELGIKFADLGLHDNQMWSKRVLKTKEGDVNLPYFTALKYGLPTKEQYEVLFNHSRQDFQTFFTPFGVDLIVPYNSNNGEHFLWVKTDDIKNDEALAYKIVPGKKPELVRRFTGSLAMSFIVKSIG